MARYIQLAMHMYASMLNIKAIQMTAHSRRAGASE